MTNWQDIHPNFTSELQKEWEERGFSKENCQEWINSGIEIKDADFCAWLRDYENKNAEWVSRHNNDEKLRLRKEHKNHTTDCRNILLIGRTGNGKSTLANVLISKDNNFEEVFKESGKGVSETKEISDKAFEINRVKYRIIDTPGLGDTGVSRIETLQEIAKVYDKIKIGLSQVLFINRGRFTPEEVETFDLLKEVIFDENVTQYTTIIRTDFVDFEDEKECESDIKLLLKENSEEISKMIESCNKRIIHIDNPPINIKGERGKRENSNNKKVREISKVKIIKRLMECEDTYIPENIDLLTKIEIKEKYKVFGLCQKCNKTNTWYRWCKTCNAQHFEEGFCEWTSSNLAIDNFIKKYQMEAINKWGVLEWIPYRKFTDIGYLAKGGFGEVRRAEWIDRQISHWNEEENNWERDRNYPYEVALKSLNNSQSMAAEFLREIAYYKLFKDDYDGVVKCFGISQDPETKNYVMVVDYIKNGSLRQYLQNNFSKLDFYNKLKQLRNIARGLNSIHRQNLIHRDLHPGNVLISNNDTCLITDLGLSRPANSQKQEGQIFGVLPYVTPEVLQGKPYTQAADIYSFGIIAYELFANAYPYAEQQGLGNEKLGTKICSGLRPDLDKLPIPQLLKDLIKKCWDTNPEKRPRANETYNILGNWQNKDKNNLVFNEQYQTIKDEYNAFSQNTPYKKHTSEVDHSKIINTQEIVQLLQNPDKQLEALEQELKKIEREVGQPLNDELKELISAFIQTIKITIKDKKNEEAEDKAWELEDKLKEKYLSEENIEKIMKYCERFIQTEQHLEANIEILTNK